MYREGYRDFVSHFNDVIWITEIIRYHRQLRKLRKHVELCNRHCACWWPSAFWCWDICRHNDDWIRTRYMYRAVIEKASMSVYSPRPVTTTFKLWITKLFFLSYANTFRTQYKLSIWCTIVKIRSTLSLVMHHPYIIIRNVIITVFTFHDREFHQSIPYRYR